MYAPVAALADALRQSGATCSSESHQADVLHPSLPALAPAGQLQPDAFVVFCLPLVAGAAPCLFLISSLGMRSIRFLRHVSRPGLDWRSLRAEVAPSCLCCHHHEAAGERPCSVPDYASHVVAACVYFWHPAEADLSRTRAAGIKRRLRRQPQPVCRCRRFFCYASWPADRWRHQMSALSGTSTCAARHVLRDGCRR